MTTTLRQPFGRPLRRLVGAEAITTRATPTAKILFAAAIVLAGAACAATFAASNAAGRRFDDTLTVRTAMHTSTVSVMILAMISAIVAVTGDFRHGRIDQLFLSAPNRSVVLWAKAAISATIGVVYGIGGAIIGGSTALIWFRAKGETLDLSRQIVYQPLLGVILAAPMFALIGVGISAATRHQAATIGAVLGWILLIEPLAATALPDIARWFPLAAALALTNSPNDALLSPLSGGVVLAAYSAVSILIGRAQLRRNDF